MDPISQAVLGGVAGIAVGGRRLGRRALWVGLAAGAAADLDVFLRSDSDPLMGWMLHRHFTHGLGFVPLGAALAVLPWLLFARPKCAESRIAESRNAESPIAGPRDEREGDPPLASGAHRWWIYATALAAYGTHGFLDAATSYGTLVWWPFSQARVAWDWLPVVEPLFTVPLVVCCAAFLAKGKALWGWLGLAIALLCGGFGALQHHKATPAIVAVHPELAGNDTLRVMPQLPTVFVFRAAWRADGVIHGALLRVVPFQNVAMRAEAPLPAAAGADLPLGAPARHDLDRFQWFADGFASVLPPRDGEAFRFGDQRYTRDGGQALWGIALANAGSAATRWSALSEAAYDGQGADTAFVRHLGFLWRVVWGDTDGFEVIPDT